MEYNLKKRNMFINNTKSYIKRSYDVIHTKKLQILDQ